MDVSPARELPYYITRLEWTDGHPAAGSFPYFRKMKPSMFLKWYRRKKVACAQKPLNWM